MKLCTFISADAERIGALVDNRVVDLCLAHAAALTSGASLQYGVCTANMVEFLQLGDAGIHELRSVVAWFSAQPESVKAQISYPVDGLQFQSPVPRPTSMRDGYAFRQHVEAARRNRGLEMIPEFDEIPIFYFTNHQAVFGPGDVHVQDLHCQQLDFELECAIVIGK